MRMLFAVAHVSAPGGVAEVHGRTASGAFDANDPLQTSDVQCNQRSGCGTALHHLHIPKNRGTEPKNITDVPSEGRWLHPFAPRHVSHFV